MAYCHSLKHPSMRGQVINMGKRRDYQSRKDAKAKKIQSIMMMPRDWLKRLYESKEDVRR